MIARNEVPTPLYYIQFEMTKFSSSDTGLFSLWKCFFYLVASWSSEICKTESFCLFFNFETCKRMIILFLFFLFPFFFGGGGGYWTEWLEDDEKSNSQSEFGKSTKNVNIWANRRQNRKGFVLQPGFLEDDTLPNSAVFFFFLTLNLKKV